MNLEKQIEHYLKKLYPLNRSITGDGNRQTLKILQEIIPLKIIEYKSRSQVYDWEIPDEWNVNEAWIKNSHGEKIIDFSNNNLHLVNYSIPFSGKINFSVLKNKLHYREDIPNAIPYRTSYYNPDWGFCISYNDYINKFSMDQEYEVFIDTTLKPGSLSVGELLIHGKSNKEILISTYICHPSMANDNLSGIILTIFLAKELQKKELNFSYRFIFVPETIGAISYCANNELLIKNIDIGLVITCVGGPGKFSYKKSFCSEHELNSIVEDVFNEREIDYITYPFDIHGSDERQFSSIGFRINTITISKDKYYEYPFYHTSLDNLDFVRPEYINESLNVYLNVVEKIDKNIIYKNLQPNCESMLARHNLYPSTGGKFIPQQKLSELDIILWILFLSDGKRSLYNISKEVETKIEIVYEIAAKLEKKRLLDRSEL